MTDSQNHDRSIAEEVQKAVNALNTALSKAAAVGLHVDIRTVHYQQIDQRYGRDMYSASVERRVPVTSE